MEKNIFKARFLPPLLLAGALMVAGCSDSDYDFGKIDSTIGIGGNGLEIPASSTENIKLRDVLELEAGGSVVEAENGDYVFRQTGNDVAPAHPLIDKITVKEDGKPTTVPIDLRFVAANGAKARTAAAATILYGEGNIFDFSYQGDKPAEVTELKEAEMTGPVELTFKFPAKLRQTVSSLAEMTLTLPYYLSAGDNGSSITPEKKANNQLLYRNVPVSRDFVVRLNLNRLDFSKASDGNGNSIDQRGSVVKMAGKVHVEVKGVPQAGADLTADLGQITGVFDSRQFVIDAATGRFKPTISLNNLGDVTVNGVPDFLKDGNVVVDLYNPQIALAIANDMQVEGTVDGKITAVKNGAETASVNVSGIRVEGGKTTTVCICRRSEGVQGYDQVKVVPELSSLINTIPDRITFTASATADDTKTGRFELGHQYTIQPAYSVDAPLAFAENADIEYRDTLDGWNDDIKRMKLADDAYLQLTANATSCVPAYLTLGVTPVDASKNPVSGINVELVQKEVKASADGVEPAASPLEVKITQTDPEAMKRLDGVLISVSGKAQGSGPAVTGITLNAEKHTLRLTDIKIKVVGKVIGDFN